MKRNIITTIFLMLWAGVVVGQSGTQAQDEVTATAQVLSDLGIDVIQNVNFGDVDSDLSPSPAIDPVNGTATNQQGSATRGIANISGETNAMVIISTPETVTLEGPDPSNTMDFKPSLAYTQGHTASEGSVFTTEAQELDGDGEGRVFIGGSLENPQNVVAGTYEGTFNLTIEYDL